MAAALLGAAPPEVVIEPPSSRREGDAEALSVRATDLVAADLARLGAAVWPRPASVHAPVAGTVPLSVTVRIGARDVALLARAGAHTATTSGTVDGLDAAATRIARALAPRLGLRASDDAARVLGAADPTPELVHRALGQAALDLTIGQPHRARLRFGRAEEIWRGTVIPAAIEGTWAAMLRAARSPEDAVATADPLARSALEKAEMALRDRAPARALTGLASALRYWPDRAVLWALPLDPAVEVQADAHLWWLTGGAGRSTDRAIEPRTGAVVRELPARGRWLGALGEDGLRLEDGALVRLTTAGAARWKRVLPWSDARVDLGAVAGGFVLAYAPAGLAWIDASTGAIAQADPGAAVLAVGLDGALVRLVNGELALMRAGRRAPAWTAPCPPRVQAALVPGRVLLLSGGEVRVLDSVTGKPRGAAIAAGTSRGAAPSPVAGAIPGAPPPEPPEASRWLGAEGRHAIVGVGREAVVIDALGAREVIRLAGPGEAVAATSADSGVAVAFETGDVVLLDREGTVADRARVIGRPRAMWPGRPQAPGFVVRTERGLIALGPVPTADRPRDLDVALRLAEQCRAQGDVRGALRLVEGVALLGGGRTLEAETLRAALLGADTRAPAAVRRAAAAAARRAAAARDLGVPLPPFSLE